MPLAALTGQRAIMKLEVLVTRNPRPPCGSVGDVDVRKSIDTADPDGAGSEHRVRSVTAGGPRLSFEARSSTARILSPDFRAPEHCR